MRMGDDFRLRGEGSRHVKSDTGGVAAVAEADVIGDLSLSMAPVIVDDHLDDDRRHHQLQGLRRGERVVTGRLFDYAERLGALTEWSEATLLERIGCDLGSEEELQILPKSRLANCELFLRLLCDAAEAVSTTPNRRASTMTLAELIMQTRQDAKGLERLLHSGKPSPFELIRAGEIAEAARLTRVMAGAARPEDVEDGGPYESVPQGHISTPQLDAYLRGRSDVIGQEVLEGIRDHLKGCDACRDVADDRRRQLAIS